MLFSYIQFSHCFFQVPSDSSHFDVHFKFIIIFFITVGDEVSHIFIMIRCITSHFIITTADFVFCSLQFVITGCVMYSCCSRTEMSTFWMIGSISQDYNSRSSCKSIVIIPNYGAPLLPLCDQKTRKLTKLIITRQNND